MSEQIIFLQNTQLVRHPQNMRRRYPLPELRRMGVSQADRASRGEQPCVQPLIVTPGVGVEAYDSRKHHKLIIVAGHLRHAGNAWLKERAPKLNCVLRYYKTEAALLADMSAENGIRADIGVIGWALHYQNQLAGGQRTLGQIARDAGKSIYQIENTLKLLKLSAAAQDLIDAGRLPVSACEPLLRITDAREQGEAARRFAKLGFSVRQIEVAIEALETRGVEVDKAGKEYKRLAKPKRARMGPETPALVGLPASQKATLRDLREAAAITCHVCPIGRTVQAAEPAWHLATAAAGAVCSACDLRAIRGACQECPLPQMLSRVTREFAGKRSGTGARV